MPLFSLFRNVVASSLIAGLLASCAPTVTSLRLEPVSGDVTRIDGRPVTKAEHNGIGVVASFEREDLEFVTLDVEIKNRTGQPIDVNPADFHFVALGARQDTLPDPLNSHLALSRAAADPAYEAGRIGLKRKQEEKRLKRAKIFNTVLMVAAVASDVSSSSRSRSYGEYVNNRIAHNIAYQGLAVKRVIDYKTFADRMERYDYEEYRWRELALKANTLAPGESIRGFVYLPKVANANYLAVSYSIPEQASVPLLFRQELVKERQPRTRR
ncbi:hypothetical protein HNV11_15080 [Spirosoma taeanense]|uniref:DUF4352 domain-containing protein n=1 Tax=Spirosoma taeanense TaxID=2735870 RepID=A0A6M5YCH6_9BACT|nr:hypothetical protein [Spirosoma taeanense]QJW90612.1 hypothetical protein HNV11_15080 [Spirosoma taeanense]